MTATTRTLTVEVCNNGTITRACARTLNAALGTKFSGSTHVDDVVALELSTGATWRYVDAATLSGHDKARHTIAVQRAQRAQFARVIRKARALDLVA